VGTAVVKLLWRGVRTSEYAGGSGGGWLGLLGLAASGGLSGEENKG